MDRRLTAVFTTVMLSILALVDAAANTSNKPTHEKRPAAISSRASSSTRSRESRIPAARGARRCAPCAGALAKNRRGRSIQKSVKIAKNLPCHPKNYINPKLARSYNAALRDMKRAGIKPQVTSLWRSSENQAQLHRCSLSTRCRLANPGLYRALPPGKSLHEAGFAVDMAGIAAGPRGQKRLTQKGRRIVGIMRKNGFKWRYGLADPAHFEADPRKHGYGTARQAIARTQTTCQINLAKTKARKHTANKVAAGRPQAPAKARFPGDAAVTKARRPTGRVRA